LLYNEDFKEEIDGEDIEIDDNIMGFMTPAFLHKLS
jgi:hypothetical protein